MTSHRPPGLSGNWGNEAKDLHVCWLLRGRKRRTQGLSFTQGQARGSSKGQELPQPPRCSAQPGQADAGPVWPRTRQSAPWALHSGGNNVGLGR